MIQIPLQKGAIVDLTQSLTSLVKTQLGQNHQDCQVLLSDIKVTLIINHTIKVQYQVFISFSIGVSTIKR